MLVMGVHTCFGHLHTDGAGRGLRFRVPMFRVQGELEGG